MTLLAPSPDERTVVQVDSLTTLQNRLNHQNLQKLFQLAPEGHWQLTIDLNDDKSNNFVNLSSILWTTMDLLKSQANHSEPKPQYKLTILNSRLLHGVFSDKLQKLMTHQAKLNFDIALVADYVVKTHKQTAFSDWYDQLAVGDKLPQGKHFKKFAQNKGRKVMGGRDA